MLPSSSLSSSFQSAPPEIICRIVDAAVAQPDVSVALSLARVSSWVRARVDLLIYRTVVLSSASKIRLFAYTVSARPASFFAHHVRRLWIASTDGDELWLTPEATRHIHTIITTCSSVFDLTLDQSILMDNPNFPCRPTSLTVVPSAFIFFLHFTSPIVERVTHLYLLNGQLHHGAVPSVARLPALTHLAMSHCDHANTDYVLKNIAALLGSMGLRSLVITPWKMPLSASSSRNPENFSRVVEQLASLDDPRVTILSDIIDLQDQFEQWKTQALIPDWWCDRE